MVPSSLHGVFESFLRGNVRKATPEASSSPFPSASATGDDAGSAPVGKIALDVYEEDGYYIIKAPIAGVKLADIDIDVVGNVITIRGKREQSEEFPNERCLLRECFWGEFSRSVTLPHAINPSRVKATFSKDSILKIYIPKEGKIKIVKINEGG